MLLATLQRGVLLLILPFITHAMSPAEYGAASMLTASALLLTAIIAAPLEILVFRTVARRDEETPALLRVTGMYCYIVLPAAAAIVATVVALTVTTFLDVSGRIWALELLAIGFQPALSVYALSVVQAGQELRRFVWLSGTSIVFIAASKLAFVVIWPLTVLGWVLSDLFSAVMSAVIAAIFVRVPRIRVTLKDIRAAVRFAAPLIPHRASLWAVNSLSRPALAAVSTLTQVGLLSFGLNLTSVAMLFLAAINRAALPRFSREIFQAPTHETFEPVRWQLVAAFVVPAVIGAGVALAGPLIFAEAYWPSFPIAGILLVAQAAYGLYVLPMNYLTLTAGLPKYSVLASGAGAALIFAWILLGGQKYGAYGVAYATAAGYVTMAILTVIIARQIKLDIAWSTWRPHWPEFTLSAIALAFSAGALFSPVGTPLAWALSAACLTITSAAILLTSRRKPSVRQ